MCGRGINFISQTAVVFNFYNKILSDPIYHRQFSCGDTLVTKYNCPLENKYQDMWSQHNYIACVIEGRKIWHTAYGSYDLRKVPVYL